MQALAPFYNTARFFYWTFDVSASFLNCDVRTYTLMIVQRHEKKTETCRIIEKKEYI